MWCNCTARESHGLEGLGPPGWHDTASPPLTRASSLFNDQPMSNWPTTIIISIISIISITTTHQNHRHHPLSLKFSNHYPTGQPSSSPLPWQSFCGCNIITAEFQNGRRKYQIPALSWEAATKFLSSCKWKWIWFNPIGSKAKRIMIRQSEEKGEHGQSLEYLKSGRSNTVSFIWILEIAAIPYHLAHCALPARPPLPHSVPHCSGEIRDRGWVGGLQVSDPQTFLKIASHKFPQDVVTK